MARINSLVLYVKLCLGLPTLLLPRLKLLLSPVRAPLALKDSQDIYVLLNELASHPIFLKNGVTRLVGLLGNATCEASS